jgi:hypothetical protein
MKNNRLYSFQDGDFDIKVIIIKLVVLIVVLLALKIIRKRFIESIKLT